MLKVPQRVVVGPRPADPEGLEVPLFAMTLGARRAYRGRAAFEFVAAHPDSPCTMLAATDSMCHAVLLPQPAAHVLTVPPG